MTKPRRPWPAFILGFCVGGLCASILLFSFWRWGAKHWQVIAVKTGYAYWQFDEYDMPHFKWVEKVPRNEESQNE